MSYYQTPQGYGGGPGRPRGQAEQAGQVPGRQQPPRPLQPQEYAHAQAGHASYDPATGQMYSQSPAPNGYHQPGAYGASPGAPQTHAGSYAQNYDPRRPGGPAPSPGYQPAANAGAGYGYGQQQQQQQRPLSGHPYSMPAPSPGRPPYPTGYPQYTPTASPPQQFNPLPPSPQPYNPQHYAPLSSPGRPPYGGQALPPVPHHQQLQAQQPYNPAAYSIADAVDHIYGPLSGSSGQSSAPLIHNNTSPPFLGAFAQQWQPQPSPAFTPTSSVSHGSMNHGPRPMPNLQASPSQHSQQLPQPPAHGSAPLPSRPFPSPQSTQPQGSGVSASLSVKHPSQHRPFSYQLPPSTELHFDESPSPDADEEPNWNRQSPAQEAQLLRRISQSSASVYSDFTHPVQPTLSHSPSRPLPNIPDALLDIEPDVEPTHNRPRNSEDHNLEMYRRYPDENFDQDALFDQIESSFGTASADPDEYFDSRRKSRSSMHSGHSGQSDRSARTSGSTPAARFGRQMTQRSPTQRSPQRRSSFYQAEYASDDSDAEAAGGLEAMRIAEDEANEMLRRASVRDPQPRSYSPETQMYNDDINEDDEDDDYPIDMSTIGGGLDVPMTYKDMPIDVVSRVESHATSAMTQIYGHASTSSRGSRMTGLDPLDTTSIPTPPTEYSYDSPYASAHVDQSGTGGLRDALGDRKLSFENGRESLDYDENSIVNMTGATLHGIPSDMPYFASGPSTERPLPPPPGAGNQAHMPNWPTHGVQIDPDIMASPSLYNGNFPKSSRSLIQPSTPRPIEPVRAKTENLKRPLLNVTTQSTDASPIPGDLQTPATFHLPTLPSGRRLVPSKLSARDFALCEEPWALSKLAIWLRQMAEGESELREPAILEALAALFTNKVADMNITVAEALATETVEEFYRAGVLIKQEEWLQLSRAPIRVTGVFFQLTGKGCYAPSSHAEDAPAHGHCYSHLCQRTVRKVDISTNRARKGTYWADYYNLTKEQVEKADKKSLELQNNLHEVVTSEDLYNDHLNVLATVYRDGLRVANPPIIKPNRLDAFLTQVFGKLDAVKAANEEHLLPQLKYRQQEQGPWVTGFADIFRHWIRKAKTAYIEYAANFPQANFAMKQEEARNSMFLAFVNQARNNPLSERLEWTSFLRAPITRLQRYGLLLSTVQKNTPAENAIEHANLRKALDEIKAVTMECDSRVAEMGRKAEMFDLQSRLVLRQEMRHVELNLTHLGREVLHRGDLQRTGSNRFTWVQMHAILLDNYLVLAKSVTLKDAPQGFKYDVSKMPIPMDLLILEGSNDDPVEKSAYKGITTVSTSSTRPGNDKMTKSTGPLVLTHTTTTSSTVSDGGSRINMTQATIISETSRSEESGKILYPFRVRHLGRETYTLFASSDNDRQTWCSKIIEAKSKHASSLFAQNAEPFKLRVLADSAFAYDLQTPGSRSMFINGTPLHRAVQDVEGMFAFNGRPQPVCRARVNCAVTFRQPDGTRFTAVGTDYGVYFAEVDQVRGWIKSIAALKVTQIAVIEEFNLLILISDKTLIAYHLDVVCPATGMTGAAVESSSSSRKAPQKLSGSRDVAFFTVGRIKDRVLIIYKKGTLHATFKILEPVLHRVAERTRVRSFISRGNLESFREYDEFYIPTDCSGLDIFTSTLAVASTRGFEVLNLDKKTPHSVPDLTAPHVATIARRLEGQAPLAMFRLNDSEFLCVYEECAVYVSKHADISRSVVMEFVGRAKRASLVSGYLVLFDDDFVQVRDAQTGRLKQVIAGRDVRCLDDAKGGGQQLSPTAYTAPQTVPPVKTIKFALQHPEHERSQLLVELVLDEERH